MKNLKIVFIFVALFVVLFVLVLNSYYENFSSPPYRFIKQYYTFPKECKPHFGCNYKNKRVCKNAWRDCSLYQNCINGKCVNKN